MGHSTSESTYQGFKKHYFTELERYHQVLVEKLSQPLNNDDDVKKYVTNLVDRSIRECSSTLYVGMPWKQNGRPYIAIQNDHPRTHLKARSNLPKPPRSCF